MPQNNLSYFTSAFHVFVLCINLLYVFLLKNRSLTPPPLFFPFSCNSQNQKQQHPLPSQHTCWAKIYPITLCTQSRNVAPCADGLNNKTTVIITFQLIAYQSLRANVPCIAGSVCIGHNWEISLAATGRYCQFFFLNGHFFI